MTFFEFMKWCLENEAIRTEPDGSSSVQKVLEEIERWKKMH